MVSSWHLTFSYVHCPWRPVSSCCHADDPCGSTRYVTAVSAIDPATTRSCFRECRGLCNQGKPGYKRGKRDKLCAYVHLGSPHAPRYDDAEHARMLRYVASAHGFDKSPFQEGKLRRLNGISDDQVREILDKSRRRATATPGATSATPPSTTTGYSLAAAQQSSLATPSGSGHVTFAIRGYPTGKAIAKSAASHLAAEWVYV